MTANSARVAPAGDNAVVIALACRTLPVCSRECAGADAAIVGRIAFARVIETLLGFRVFAPVLGLVGRRAALDTVICIGWVPVGVPVTILIGAAILMMQCGIASVGKSRLGGRHSRRQYRSAAAT